mgnify:CR=1 FL=1
MKWGIYLVCWIYTIRQVNAGLFHVCMANAISPVPQGLSIKEKEALGWTDHSTLKTITEPGEYKVKLSGTATGTDDCIGYKAGIPELNRTLYLEYRNFSTDGSKYDKSEKQLTNSETSNIASGLVCYLAQPDIRFPSNLNGKPGNWALEVMGGTQSTKSDAALGLNDSLQVTDKLKVTVADYRRGSPYLSNRRGNGTTCPFRWTGDLYEKSRL